MVLLIMSEDVRSKPGIYGEVKKQKCFMITDFASEEMDRLAKEYKMSRSDLLERAIRAGGLELAKEYKIEELVKDYKLEESEVLVEMDRLAKEYKMSRSDLLEKIIRAGVLELAKDNQSEKKN